jgi:hypothetical protein
MVMHGISGRALLLSLLHVSELAMRFITYKRVSMLNFVSRNHVFLWFRVTVGIVLPPSTVTLSSVAEVSSLVARTGCDASCSGQLGTEQATNF